MKIYSALYEGVYPFSDMFASAHTVRLPHELTANDGILILWGGEDISPSLYGQRPNRWCGASEELSRRDSLEKNLALRAIELGMPIIGICRGAQLMCALNGGALIQHVKGHLGSHLMTTADGKTMLTSSVHHQMLYPWYIEHELIAVADPSRGVMYMGEDDELVDFPAHAINPHGKVKEPEIVMFHETNTLAIQGHPEFCQWEDPFVHYCRELVETRLFPLVTHE